MAKNFGMMLLGSVFAGVDSHAQLFEPPSRVTNGIGVGSPNCAGVSCWWANEGKMITGLPTIPFKDPTYGTMFFDKDTYCTTNPLDCDAAINGGHDMIGTFIPNLVMKNPWRHPGNAPLTNPCGVAGWGGIFGYPAGHLGTNVEPLLKQTTWAAGSTVEVAWGFSGNHGGGYQYRLCKVSSRRKDVTAEATESCFQATPLDFVGDKQYIQYGWGLDVNNRKEIPAVRVSAGTTPTGSTWTRMPIPTCNDIPRGGLGFHVCAGPMFAPPITGLFGGGPAACNGKPCTPAELDERSMKLVIVDKVKVPANLPLGDYILSLRWDVEQIPNIYSQCSDVKIGAAMGPATVPFSPWSGCEVCCTGQCSHCKACQTMKTGHCAPCWTSPSKWSFPTSIPTFQCLGHEAADGGPTAWQSGSSSTGVVWSPGCSKCWANEAAACMVSDRVSSRVDAEEASGSDSSWGAVEWNVLVGVVALAWSSF